MNASRTYYLRIEGVNLDAFVFDTRDLSTVRGGSLLLLDAVQAARDELQRSGANPRALSMGASAGFFEITTDDPVGVATTVRETLRSGKWKHATFVVDVVAAGEGVQGAFRKKVDALLTANRWRQMQASTLSVPARPSANDLASPPTCERDCLRPALRGRRGPNRDDGSQTFLSAATSVRREAGREAKQDFYERQTKLGNLPDEFAEHFEAIATGVHPLDGKLAVFYADGNAFGKLQLRLCTTPALQALWDHFILKTRREFLTTFLREEVQEKAEWKVNGKVARFETLLWGGDELMFVMPASLGWRFAAIFFDKLGGISVANASFPTRVEDAEHPFAGNTTRFSEQQILTYTAALVFCQHHAPIDRIKNLAKDGMAEFAKSKNRERDQLTVVALESFDHLGTSYEQAMKRRYAGVVDPSDMIIAAPHAKPLGEILRLVAAQMAGLKSGEETAFPRCQLRALVKEMLADPLKAAATAAFLKNAQGAEILPRAFRNATEEDRKAVRSLRALFPHDRALWIQMEELWDYTLL